MTLMNDLSSILLILSLSRESKCVLRFTIGDLVNPSKATISANVIKSAAVTLTGTTHLLHGSNQGGDARHLLCHSAWKPEDPGHQPQ